VLWKENGVINMAYTDTSFLAKLKPFVLADMRSSGILASLTAAQAFIESNKGNSGLTVKCNNLFGIKGKYKGQSGSFMTTEYYNGVKQRVMADFRKYPSWQESIADHSSLFNRLSRYSNLRGLKDYKLACKYVKDDGYATSPTYTQTLINTIEKYQLYDWDNEVLNGTVPATENVNRYIVGKNYRLQSNMYIRLSALGEKKPFLKLSTNAKSNGYEDDEGYGILKKGTVVTCKEVKKMPDGSTWIKIPSGWICGVADSGKVYVM